MQHMSTPVHIGNGAGRKPRRLPFRVRARIALETALGERGIVPDVRFERPSSGDGVVAVVIDGEKRLYHLGTDEADAMFQLSRLASRPAGRW